MALFTVAGNVQAVNARMILIAIPSTNGESYQEVYSNATGDYIFSNVAQGTYKLTADLSQCTTSPYNVGYSYRQQINVQVVANNLSGLNMTPVLLNAANPVNNQV
jgi:hypothetical protein